MKRFELRPGFVVLLCALYSISPDLWFLPFLTLLSAHELAHMLALWAFRIPIQAFRLTALGAQLQTSPIPPAREFWCAWAGPAMNLLLFAVLLPLRPYWAVLSLLLAGFNLLPLYPLDGGRALRCLLCSRLSLQGAARAERTVSAVVWCLLAAAALCATAKLRLGIWPILVCALVLLRAALCSRN